MWYIFVAVDYVRLLTFWTTSINVCLVAYSLSVNGDCCQKYNNINSIGKT